ncbi:hypothetical protein LINPERPRIM_LOCUS23592 [Linum perenne]
MAYIVKKLTRPSSETSCFNAMLS